MDLSGHCKCLLVGTVGMALSKIQGWGGILSQSEVKIYIQRMGVVFPFSCKTIFNGSKV